MKLRSFVSVLFGTLLIANTAMAASGKPTVNEIVFMQNSATATLTKTEEGYDLVLAQVGNSIQRIPTAITSKQLKNGFSDFVKNEPVTKYLKKAWGDNKGSFSKNNPNATVTGDIGSDTVSFIVTLTQAVYDASNHTLTYHVKALGKTNSLETYAGKTINNPTLFIDGYCGGNVWCEVYGEWCPGVSTSC